MVQNLLSQKKSKEMSFMSEYIKVTIKKNTGIIALNRPKAINALNFEMINAIDKALDEFENNSAINGVLLKSATERGFCAGGDIRAARQYVLDGNIEEMQNFFAAEYALDGKIAKYEKPLVVITDGIVMGGGLGLAGHAQFRITTTQSRFAMPEAAIGFVCDCAIDAILAKIERHIALAFLMSGEIVGANDALALGLADCIISTDSISVVARTLIDALHSNDTLINIREILAAENQPKNDTPFIDKANICKPAFTKSSSIEIINNLKDLSQNAPQAKSLYQKLISLCPTSLSAIVISHDKARQDIKLDLILHSDFLLATWIATRADFVEGVRSVVIDKDQNPNWQPSDFKQINEEKIRAILDKF